MNISISDCKLNGSYTVEDYSDMLSGQINRPMLVYPGKSHFYDRQTSLFGKRREVYRAKGLQRIVLEREIRVLENEVKNHKKLFPEEYL